MDYPKKASVAAAGLPDDPLVEILSRVPAKSLCRFKCVSRGWRDLINDPLHRNKLPQAMEGLFFWAKRPGGRHGDGDGDIDVRHLSFIDLTARSVPLDIDSCFSVLTGLPETEILDFADSCNGLMLLEHQSKLDPDDTLGYVVFNPTTRQWGTVPTCGCPISLHEQWYTYLAFDPAISPHFHLIHWRERYGSEEGDGIIDMSVHAYSSETATWSHNQTNWVEQCKQGWNTCHSMDMGERLHAFVNGMLHLFAVNEVSMEHRILAVDVQGMIQRTISLPVPTNLTHIHAPLFAHSQGLLHCIIRDFDAKSKKLHLHVWVLQDYDAKEWVRKGTMCLPKLVGKWNPEHQLVAMHQDCNVFFFVQDWNRKLMVYDKLIAYDMDSKEVSVFIAPGNKGFHWIVATYVPYFAHLPELTNKD